MASAISLVAVPTISQMKLNELIQQRHFFHPELLRVAVVARPIDFHQPHESGKLFQTACRITESHDFFRRIITAQRLDLVEKARESTQETVFVEGAGVPFTTRTGQQVEAEEKRLLKKWDVL